MNFRLILLLFPLFLAAFGSHAQPSGLPPGITVAFAHGESSATDTIVLSNVWLHVPQNQSATPFLPPGKFTAAWTGFLNLDLRSEYRFQAEYAGKLRLQINGVTLLEGESRGAASEPSPPIRLSKGTNAFSLFFESPPAGDAWIRLSWARKNSLPDLIPSSAFTHSPSTELASSFARARGRELFLEHRCFRCHAPGGETKSPELELDAPSFDGIGSRRNSQWMARWIENPKAVRPSARMPRVLHGPSAREDAATAAAFLSTLTNSPQDRAREPLAFTADQRELGGQLFDALHCAACHHTTDEPVPAAGSISLARVNEKFSVASLMDFLKKPSGHFGWIRMPDFKLNDEESAKLAAHLLGTAPAPKPSSPPASAAIERGRRIVQNSGCLNCHTAGLENKYSAKPLASLATSAWNNGCLAPGTSDSRKAPSFDFTPEDSAALQAFAAADRASLARHVPAEFASRHAQSLRCAECHGRFEGFPRFEILGGKLKPEWSEAFIRGGIGEKPRPWIEARMPAFPAHAASMAAGLAALHGLPPATPAEPPINVETAELGRKLVSVDGGFSCVSCHAVGAQQATQVFESAGVNFAQSGARLQRGYFFRWLLNPLAIDPTTKMPVFFDETGRSPLTDVLGGDGQKQIDAFWQYVRLGKDMPPPGKIP